RCRPHCRRSTRDLRDDRPGHLPNTGHHRRGSHRRCGCFRLLSGEEVMTTAYTVYTKPDCRNCDKTKAYFDSKGITYTAVDITEVPAALEYITQELGYS